MKKAFIKKRFSPETQAIITSAEGVLDRYAAQGYDLSLRQLYYQFISADLFPASWIDEEYNRRNGLPADTKNTEKNYKNLGGIVSDARLAGLLDWDMIKDRGRELITQPHWASPQAIIEASAEQFQIDKWADQRNHIEVMVEKQALEGVLIPVCEEMDVPFIANKGYSSSSALYEAGRRMVSAMHEDKDICVIYLGDHDPSGIDMSRDVQDRLRLFTHYTDGDEQCVNLYRVALNLPQIKVLRPPPNPAKITDSRAADYISRFGESSWELDAIEPRALGELVRKQVIALRDDRKWEASLKREHAMKAELLVLAKKSKFK
jgi:hypothetical protein